MLDYYAAQQLHISQAQAGLTARYPYWQQEFPSFPRASQTAYGLAVRWMAEFVDANPQWVEQLKRVAKKPIVDAIVARLGLTGIEVSLAGLFVGILLDVAFAAFIKWEQHASRAGSGQTMFAGSMRDTFARWSNECTIPTL